MGDLLLSLPQHDTCSKSGGSVQISDNGKVVVVSSVNDCGKLTISICTSDNL